MATTDLTQASERFLGSMRRVEAGLIVQRQRALARSTEDERVLGAGSGVEVVAVLRGPGIDLDYYVFELGRLRHAAAAVITVWKRATQHEPQSVVDALAAFDAAIPKLKDVRDPITHPNNDGKLSGLAWFTSLVALHPSGRVEYLVDPDSYQHDVAVALTEAVVALCQKTIRDAIAADPPKPLDQQISERNAKKS